MKSVIKSFVNCGYGVKEKMLKKIKIFSVSEHKNIEGQDAELYCNFYLVFNRSYIFTFLIESPNFGCSDRHPIRLIKHWIMEIEEQETKYLRRYEKTLDRSRQGR